jgi:hypothetical protein
MDAHTRRLCPQPCMQAPRLHNGAAGETQAECKYKGNEGTGKQRNKESMPQVRAHRLRTPPLYKYTPPFAARRGTCGFIQSISQSPLPINFADADLHSVAAPGASADANVDGDRAPHAPEWDAPGGPVTDTPLQ